MKKLIRNQKGVTLIEVVIGGALLATVLTLFINSGRMSSDLVENVELQTILGKNIQTYIESITSNIGYYQIDFEDVANFTEEEDSEKLSELLPLAWNKRVITEIELCDKCPGRLGFVVIPLSNEYRGLFKVIFKATHPELQGDILLVLHSS